MEEADELHDHADFCKSLARWNILNSEDNAEPNVEALRLEAREAKQKADKLVWFTQDFNLYASYGPFFVSISTQNDQITTRAFPTEDG